MLRKLKLPISKSAVEKIKRTTSLPKNIFSFEKLPFDIQLELSLSRSKSEHFIFEVIYDPLQFESHSHYSGSISARVDHELWLNFYKLESLLDQLQITIEKAYIQYHIEHLIVVSSSTTPPNTSTTFPNTSSTSCLLPPRTLVSSYLPTQPIVVLPPPLAIMA